MPNVSWLADSSQGQRLLVVEDDPAQAQGVLDLFANAAAGYRVAHVSCLADALEELRRHGADAILLDLTLPDSAGLDSVSRVRQAAPGTPLIVLTSVDDERIATEAARRGAQDYLVKGTFKWEVLERAVRLALERSRLQRMLEDTNARLEVEVRTDPLTTALNRRGLRHVLEAELLRSRREEREVMAVLVDLDDFKRINDQYGYAVGDTVLVEAVRRIRSTLRRTDHLARIGGDEFLVLLPGTRPAEARMLAEKVRLAIGAVPLEVGGEEPIAVTASLGLLVVQDSSIDALLSRGGGTLRLSKLAGKDRVSAPGEDAAESGDRLAAVVRAVAAEGLTALVAPVVRVADEAVAGIEIFTRSSLPGFESPLDFFRVALRTELLTRIDLRCLEVCVAARPRSPGGSRVFLNVMPSTIAEVPVADLLAIVRGVDDGRRVVLDLSERQIVGDPRYLEEPIEELRRAGVGIALDDCGWGRGCLESLILLRPDVMKLRPRLIREATQDEPRANRLRRLVEVGRRLGCEILGEGVGSREELALLAGLGVTLAQGPLWPREDLVPVPPAKRSG